jgi:hypothetical protein
MIKHYYSLARTLTHLDLLEGQDVAVPSQHADGLVVQLHGLLVVPVVDHALQALGQLVEEAQAVQQPPHAHQLVHLCMNQGRGTKRVVECEKEARAMWKRVHSETRSTVTRESWPYVLQHRQTVQSALKRAHVDSFIRYSNRTTASGKARKGPHPIEHITPTQTQRARLTDARFTP